MFKVNCPECHQFTEPLADCSYCHTERVGWLEVFAAPTQCPKCRNNFHLEVLVEDTRTNEVIMRCKSCGEKFTYSE